MGSTNSFITLVLVASLAVISGMLTVHQSLAPWSKGKTADIMHTERLFSEPNYV